MAKTGRPPVKPAKLMDGFYIEVRNKGSKEKGIKIRCKSKIEMENTVKEYSRNKDVVVLGEYKDEKWLN